MTKIQKTDVLQSLSVKELLYTVDSFALILPLDLTTITHDTLNQEVGTHNLKTGFVEDESYKKNALEVKVSHYSAWFKIVKHYVGTSDRDGSNIYIDGLSIGINAKFLEGKYFEGVRIDNISTIYENLISLNVFTCTYEDFLNGYVNDYEIKKDEYTTKETYKAGIKAMDSVIPPSKSLNRGTAIFKTATNMGLQFNSRRNVTASHPFLKTYFKEIELKNKSFKFYDKFLTHYNIEGLARVEFAVSNVHVKKKYNVGITTLKELLEATQEEFKRIHQAFVYQNFKNAMKSLKTSRNTSGLSPTDEALCFLIEVAMENKMAIDLIIFGIQKRLDCKVKRSRMKERITNLYLENIKDQKPYKEADEMTDFLKFFGGGNTSFLTGNDED